MRSFAKPAPHTMTKEWQEATNEYLKVRSPLLCCCISSFRLLTLVSCTKTGAKLRPLDRYLVRGLRWQGPRPVSLGPWLNHEPLSFVNRLSIINILTAIIAYVTRVQATLSSWKVGDGGRRTGRIWASFERSRGTVVGTWRIGVNTVQRGQCDIISLVSTYLVLVSILFSLWTMEVNMCRALTPSIQGPQMWEPWTLRKTNHDQEVIARYFLE